MIEYNLYKRYKRDELKDVYEKFNLDNPFVEALNLIKDMIIIVNETRQIIFANNAIVESLGYRNCDELLGLRFGEIVSCVYNSQNELGCGTSQHCKTCNALNITLRSLINREKAVDIERIITDKIDGLLPMDIEIASEIYSFNGKEFAIINIRDIKEKIRKDELEKIFYHDILNTSGGIKGILEILSKEVKSDCKDDFEFANFALKDLIETIELQRKISLQYGGVINLNLDIIESMDLLNSMRAFFIKMGAITEERIVIHINSKSVEFETDIIVLKRILHNMIKNAIEATSKNGIVTIGCEKINNFNIKLWVHNSESINSDVANEIFNRRVSSKGNNRGWGTFSMKLLGENFLKSKVYFESSELNGTTFNIEIPVNKLGGTIDEDINS